ncbi:AAA family ATPase [Acinetobacter bereziniae]|uniref:AAA family ATPase n=1 Tax=Acinetobacter bereziniae TaxID=106648 RepID=UPI00124FD72E|nr:AAA family ATPase [Acinetobacter bereziniae]
MINQITLNNIASYKKAIKLETDKKVNIIYGLNGSGKSTFSNYFYSPGSIEFQNCSHQGQYDSILVYNQKFIQDNFYAKDTLNGIFSLSKENKAAQEKVQQITAELQKISEARKKLQLDITQQNTNIKDCKEKAQSKIWDIKTNYSGGDRVLEFCLKGKMGSKEALFNHLLTIPLPTLKPSRTIENLKIDANAIDGDTATKHSLLETLPFMNLPDDDLIILKEIILGSSDSPISNLINKLQNSDWVNEGLKYIELTDNSQCPFCQSRTITKQLVDQINDYFDETYKESLSKVKSVQNRYERIINNIPSLETYSAVPFASNLLIELNEYLTALKNTTNHNLENIKQKVSNPSIQVSIVDTSKIIEELNVRIKIINNDITIHNDKIDNIDNELEKIKSEFWTILRFEYDQTISNFNQVRDEAEKIIKEKIGVDNNLKIQADQKDKDRIFHQKSTVNIEDAISNINQGLIDIGIIDFHIEKYDEELYRIVRTDSKIKIFSSLSEGEKMIISFLYFRELLRGKLSSTEGQLKKIAIIDDPVSSLSHIFVYNIGRLLRNDFFNSPNITQVFVLTHSLYFFYELTETNPTYRKEKQKLFRLSKNTDGSSIEVMKYEEIQNDYQSYWSIINDDKQPPALIANCMRNIIEYFFNFVQKSDLGNVTQKPELQNVKHQAFIRYINRESHSLGQNIFDFKEFNYNDFKDGLKLIFEHTGYSDHYNKMSKI